MLPEWLESLMTPRTEAVRALGYLRELRNIRRRFRNFGAEWKPHCERTRNVLRTAAARCRQHRKAVLCGTGYLHDVPLDELAAQFREVILVDVLHPVATRRKARKLPNVRLLAADVSGTVEAIHQAGQTKGSPLPSVAPTFFHDDPEVDLIASINLLSQLPCMPERYLLDQDTHDSDTIVPYARAVIRSHLAWLRQFDAVAALIADVETTTLDLQGNVVRKESTLYGLDPDWKGESWTWTLVPFSLAPPHHTTILRILATPDLGHETRRNGSIWH
jgi:hypothetical protein